MPHLLYYWELILGPLNTEKLTAHYEVCYQGALFSAKEEKTSSEMSVLVDLKLLGTVWSQKFLFLKASPTPSQALLQSKEAPCYEFVS